MDAIVLGPVCKLRKIFTMRNRLVDAERDCNSSSSCAENSLPPEHMFALGVDNAIQVLDTTSLPMITKNSLDLSNGKIFFRRFDMIFFFLYDFDSINKLQII